MKREQKNRGLIRQKCIQDAQIKAFSRQVHTVKPAADVLELLMPDSMNPQSLQHGKTHHQEPEYIRFCTAAGDQGQQFRREIIMCVYHRQIIQQLTQGILFVHSMLLIHVRY